MPIITRVDDVLRFLVFFFSGIENRKIQIMARKEKDKMAHAKKNSFFLFFDAELV